MMLSIFVRKPDQFSSLFFNICIYSSSNIQYIQYINIILYFCQDKGFMKKSFIYFIHFKYVFFTNQIEAVLYQLTGMIISQYRSFNFCILIFWLQNTTNISKYNKFSILDLQYIPQNFSFCSMKERNSLNYFSKKSGRMFIPQLYSV